MSKRAARSLLAITMNAMIDVKAAWRTNWNQARAECSIIGMAR
jgi:hypothetical protein